MDRCEGGDLKKRGVEHDMFGRPYENSDDPSGAVIVLGAVALIIVAIAVALLVMLR